MVRGQYISWGLVLGAAQMQAHDIMFLLFRLSREGGVAVTARAEKLAVGNWNEDKYFAMDFRVLSRELSAATAPQTESAANFADWWEAEL